MATRSIKSQGTTLSYSVGSPTSYVALAKITGLGGPDGSASIVDDSDLSDTWKRKFASMVDAGNATFDLNIDPANSGHAALQAAFAAGTQLEFKVTPPAGTLSLYFAGYVSGFALAAPQDSKYTAKLTVAIDGPYAWL